jgi:hypothetical protein
MVQVEAEDGGMGEVEGRDASDGRRSLVLFHRP